MTSPFEFVLKNLVNLHNETAMLEICGWDEDKLAILYKNLESSLLEVNTPITENLKTFCSQQFYIERENRESLYELLEQAMINELKEISNKQMEYEN